MNLCEKECHGLYDNISEYLVMIIKLMGGKF